jgi:adenylate cyclase
LADIPETSYLVVRGADDEEERVPIHGHLAVGRHCRGVADPHRLIVDDPSVSSYHLDIRLDTEQDRAEVTDLSTNGTRLNGVRIQRGVPTPLRARDQLTVGRLELVLISDRFQTDWTRERTRPAITTTETVMAVGDVIGFSTFSEHMDSEPLTTGMSRLFGELHRVLRVHEGTLAANAGDALLALWEVSAFPDAADRAIEFALAASTSVSALADDLPFPTPPETGLTMGWAVVAGGVGITSMAGASMTVLGDAANLAFRLSGLAGRAGRPNLLVTEEIRARTTRPHGFLTPERVTVRGRAGVETTFGVAPLEQQDRG